jgi:hypothetical protein
MNLFSKGLIRGVIPFSLLVIISLYNKFQGAASSNIFLFYSLIAFFLRGGKRNTMKSKNGVLLNKSLFIIWSC